MKILITSDLFLPTVNGVVTSVLSLAHGLREHGHEVKILTLSDTVHTHTDGDVIYLGSFGAGLLYPGIRIRGFCPRKVLRELIRWHPDIVHSQCEFSTFPIAKTIAKRCGAPLVHTYHTVYEDYTHYFTPCVRMGRAVAARFTRHIVNRTDAVIAPTEKIRRLLTAYRVRVPISVIPTGLEPPSFAEAPQSEPPALRRKHGIPENQKILLYLGRLAEEKNIPALFGLLNDPNLHNTVLVLVGDGPFRAALERTAQQMRLSERVLFIGMVPHSAVPDYYRLGDVFVNASESETQGLTYIEAMAAGIPVVCRNDPCLEGLIETGKNGFACCDTTEMAGAITKLLTEPSLRQSVTDAASETVRQAYTSAAFAASAEKLYTNLFPCDSGKNNQIISERNVTV